jgi:hypothetical protein
MNVELRVLAVLLNALQEGAAVEVFGVDVWSVDGKESVEVSTFIWTNYKVI